MAHAPDAPIRELEYGTTQPPSTYGARSRAGREDLCSKDPHVTLLPPNLSRTQI